MIAIRSGFRVSRSAHVSLVERETGQGPSELRTDIRVSNNCAPVRVLEKVIRKSDRDENGAGGDERGGRTLLETNTPDYQRVPATLGVCARAMWSRVHVRAWPNSYNFQPLERVS